MKPRIPSMYPRREAIGRWDWGDRFASSNVPPDEPSPRESGSRLSPASVHPRLYPATAELRAAFASSAPRLSVPSSSSRLSSSAPRYPSSAPRLLSAAPRLSTPVPAQQSWVPASESRLSSSVAAEGTHRASDLRTLAARKELPFARLVAGKPPALPVVVAIHIGVQMDALRYTHAFLASYLRQRFSPSLAEPLTIAACELLDNALNYGSVSEPVLVELVESPKVAAVRVHNSSIRARVDVLVAHIERLAGPGPVFFEEIKRALAREMSRPMLGLARILHEAALDLELFVDDHRVCMTARREK